MDAFRRLRSRKKKDTNDGFMSFAKADTDYKASISADQKSAGRPSTQVSRPSNLSRTISPEQFRQVLSPNDQGHPTSINKVQPMLIGISRPSVNLSRPGTAESLQNAVDRAAESVSRNPPRASGQPANLRGVKNARYVDIFAISGHPQQKPPASFNEHVARRNLEVGSRPNSRRANDYDSTYRRPGHSMPLSSSITGSRTSSLSSQTAYTSNEHDSLRDQRARDAQQHHIQGNIRAREPAKTLPIILQERSSEDDSEMFEDEETRAAEQELELAKARLTAARNLSAIRAKAFQDRDRAYNSPRLLQPRTSNKDYQVHSITEFTQPLSQNQLQRIGPETDGTEYIAGAENRARRIPDGFTTDLDPRLRTRPTGVSSGEDPRSETLRSSSIMSTVSSSIQRSPYAGSRRVLDLTNDDIEAFSVMSYQGTPIIADATQDAFYRATPAVVEYHTPVRQTPLEPVEPARAQRRPSANEPVLDLDQLARRSQMLADTAKQTLLNQSPAKAADKSTDQSMNSPTALGFSTVTTLTSTSPRLGEVSIKPKSFANSAGLLAPVPEATSPMHTRIDFPETQVQESRPGVRTLTKDFPTDAEIAHVGVAVAHHATTVEIPHSAAIAQIIERSVSKERRVLEEAAARAKRSTANSREPRTAKSSSSHLLDSSVKTRDFAVLPQEKPSTKRIEALKESKRSNSPQKSSREEPRSALQPRRLSSDDSKPRKNAVKPGSRSESSASRNTTTKKSSKPKSSKKSRPISVFDEESFRKKQASANAALLKLQESLNENLEQSEPGTPRNMTPSITRAFSLPRDTTSTLTRPTPTYTSPASTSSAVSPQLEAFAPATLPRQHSASSYTSQNPSTAGISIDKYEDDNNVAHHPGTNIARTTTLSDPVPTLAALDLTAKSPPSPGEVSLSSFPIPTPRALSPEGPPSYVKDHPQPNGAGGVVRRGSQASRMSSASVFSIPVGMLPARVASLPVNQNRVSIPSYQSNSAQSGMNMDNIAAIIPGTSASAPTTSA